MPDYTIERGLPIPRPKRGVGNLKYPWNRMESGHSIWFELEDGTCPSRSKQNRAAAAWLKSNRPGWELVRQRENKEIDGRRVRGFRIWFVDPNANEGGS